MCQEEEAPHPTGSMEEDDLTSPRSVEPGMPSVVDMMGPASMCDPYDSDDSNSSGSVFEGSDWVEEAVHRVREETEMKGAMKFSPRPPGGPRMNSRGDRPGGGTHGGI